MSCIIIGDSIGQGVANLRPDCVDYAHSGWTSAAIGDRYVRHMSADVVVISLGSNDYAGIDTAGELRALRGRISGRRVIWILPAGVARGSGVSVAMIRGAIVGIARSHGDSVVSIGETRDGIHPSSYGRLARF